MNYKKIAVTWLGLILLTSTAISQTGYTPSSSTYQGTNSNATTPPYTSNGQAVNPVPARTDYNYNGANGTSRSVPSVPNSGFVNPMQTVPAQGNGSYPIPATQQRTVPQNTQNGIYPTQPMGQTQPSRQTQPMYPTQPSGQPQPSGQTQPIQQSQPMGPSSNAPFELTPQQQDQVNKVLAFWESYTRGIKKFEADFDLYSYPAVSVGGTDVNASPQVQQTTGFLKYEAPNKGIFRVDGPPKELYRCNGKSVYTYNFDKKEINEYKYSDGMMNGQELKKGPMAFLFGASAATLRDRYWIRLLPLPPGAPQGQIWLEAYPKYQEDLQDMTKAELIINVRPCKPVAFQRYSPNGDRQSYALKNIKVNKIELFGGEPFEPNERGWTVIMSSQAE